MTIGFSRIAAGMLAAAPCLAGTAATADEKAPDHCIVGDNAIGCVSEAALADIVGFSGNLNGLRSAIAEKLASGACDLFEYGERVYVTATDGSDRYAVRRPDENDSYWMPASWSRPASECRANASPGLVDRKIGMPTPERPDWHVRPTPALTREMLPRLPIARHCEFKSVMTDAEIRACRRMAREAPRNGHGE